MHTTDRLTHFEHPRSIHKACRRLFDSTNPHKIFFNSVTTSRQICIKYLQEFHRILGDDSDRRLQSVNTHKFLSICEAVRNVVDHKIHKTTVRKLWSFLFFRILCGLSNKSILENMLENCNKNHRCVYRHMCKLCLFCKEFGSIHDWKRLLFKGFQDVYTQHIMQMIRPPTSISSRIFFMITPACSKKTFEFIEEVLELCDKRDVPKHAEIPNFMDESKECVPSHMWDSLVSVCDIWVDCAWSRWVTPATPDAMRTTISTKIAVFLARNDLGTIFKMLVDQVLDTNYIEESVDDYLVRPIDCIFEMSSVFVRLAHMHSADTMDQRAVTLIRSIWDNTWVNPIYNNVGYGMDGEDVNGDPFEAEIIENIQLLWFFMCFSTWIPKSGTNFIRFSFLSMLEPTCCGDMLAFFLFMFGETRFAQKLGGSQFRRVILHCNMGEESAKHIRQTVDSMDLSDTFATEIAKTVLKVCEHARVGVSDLGDDIMKTWAGGKLTEKILEVGAANATAAQPPPPHMMAGETITIKPCPICYDEMRPMCVCYPCGHMFCSKCMPIAVFEKCHTCKSETKGVLDKVYE